MKNIAVMAWWDSSEYEVSLKSAKNIVNALSEIKEYRTFLVLCKWNLWIYKTDDGNPIEVNKNDFSIILENEQIKFDYAYITIHWAPWENWKLQWYFDIIGIPYSTGSVLNAAMWFDKYASKIFLQSYDILSPRWICIKKWEEYNEHDIISKLWLPLFVKPNEWWSSFGISKVKEEESLRYAIEGAFDECKSVIIEEAVDGREFTCWLFRSNSGVVVLPITEIQTEEDFFNYKAKYLWYSKEITPAQIPEELKMKIENTSRMIYEKMGCEWIVRIDYIFQNWKLYFLEINITPWMTNSSLVPQQIRAGWLLLSDVLKEFIDKKF